MQNLQIGSAPRMAPFVTPAAVGWNLSNRATTREFPPRPPPGREFHVFRETGRRLSGSGYDSPPGAPVSRAGLKTTAGGGRATRWSRPDDLEPAAEPR